MASSFSIKSCGAKVSTENNQPTEEEKGDLDYLYDSTRTGTSLGLKKTPGQINNPKNGMSIQIVRSGSKGSIHPDMH